MAKYIRTKDNIWQYNEKDNSAERPNKEFECNQIWLNIKEQDIIAQADTIKELCDKFVWVVGGNKIITNKLEDMHINADIPFEVYGAIWTDKGLTYVAKMNEKGELELL